MASCLVVRAQGRCDLFEFVALHSAFVFLKPARDKRFIIADSVNQPIGFFRLPVTRSRDINDHVDCECNKRRYADATQERARIAVVSARSCLDVGWRDLVLAMRAFAGGIFNRLSARGARKISHIASLAVPMSGRSVPQVGTVERREHRNTPPAYFLLGVVFRRPPDL